MGDIKKEEEWERRSMVRQFGVMVREEKIRLDKERKENEAGVGRNSSLQTDFGKVTEHSNDNPDQYEKGQRLRKPLRKMGVPLVASEEMSCPAEEDKLNLITQNQSNEYDESQVFCLNLPDINDEMTAEASENLIQRALTEWDNGAKAVLISVDALHPSSVSNSSFQSFELARFIRDLLRRNFSLEYRDVSSLEERRKAEEAMNEEPSFSAEDLSDQVNDVVPVFEIDPFYPLTPRQVWMEVTFSKDCYTPGSSSIEIQNQAWSWWSSLQSSVEINPKFGLCLRLDNTFSSNPKITQRWFAERLRAIIIPSHIWKSNHNGYPILPHPTKDFLIRSFHHPYITYLLETPSSTLSTVEEERLHSCFLYLLHLFKQYYKTVRDPSRQRLMRHLADIPIRPLQPLRDHLTQDIYAVFEADPIKYQLYNRAMFLALKDWKKKSKMSNGIGGSCDRYQAGDGNGDEDEPVVVAMVVGAGRGPLVTEFINAAVALDLKFRVYALDKNPIAIAAMLAKLDGEWASYADFIHIVQSDMRDFEPVDKADMIISELLGSFGCNELSPECLDGAQRLLKLGGISVPYAYSNFLQPVMARSLHDDVATYAPKHKNMLNEFILVEMRSFVEIAPYQEAFRFTHPNYDAHSNERDVTLRFKADIDYVMTGFAGYFELHLYKDVSMNILPDKQTLGLSSWFPAFFALERPVPVTKDQEIVLHMGRRCDTVGKRVWYVWNLLEPQALPVQNALPDNWISM